MRALLIVNPAAGRSGAARQREALCATLREGGWSTELVLTNAPGHAGELATDAARRGYDAVFALGGDGTQREVAVGLLGSEVPLGVLPGGTTNVLARALGIPLRAEAAARALDVRRSGIGRLDVGRCGDRPFLLMASCGVDSRALYRLSARNKRFWGRAGVLWQAMLEARKPAVPIEWSLGPPDSNSPRRRSAFVACCNIPLYGGPFRLAPTAQWDDGRLEVIAHDGLSRLSLLGFAFALACGLHGNRRHRAPCLAPPQVLTLETPADPLGEKPGEKRGRGIVVQLDGDAVRCESPVRISLGDRALSVLLPVALAGESLPLFSSQPAGEAT